jgi:hypothetical protein
MFTKKKYRKSGELIARAKLLTSIMAAYVLGAVFSGLTYYYLEFRVFYVISLCLLIVIGYDAYKIHISTLIQDTATAGFIKSLMCWLIYMIRSTEFRKEEKKERLSLMTKQRINISIIFV